MISAHLRKVLKGVVFTEKTSLSSHLYAFYVSMDSDKAKIKEVVEKLFAVSVKSVRTTIEKKPAKQTRRGSSHLVKAKKAYVTLQPDNVIDVENLESL
jgi:ribosomal protein L23